MSRRLSSCRVGRIEDHATRHAHHEHRLVWVGLRGPHRRVLEPPDRYSSCSPSRLQNRCPPASRISRARRRLWMVCEAGDGERVVRLQHASICSSVGSVMIGRVSPHLFTHSPATHSCSCTTTAMVGAERALRRCRRQGASSRRGRGARSFARSKARDHSRLDARRSARPCRRRLIGTYAFRSGFASMSDEHGLALVRIVAFGQRVSGYAGQGHGISLVAVPFSKASMAAGLKRRYRPSRRWNRPSRASR